VSITAAETTGFLVLVKTASVNLREGGVLAARHVFLSFVEEDLELVKLFRGQARNKNSALAFDDYSVKVAYNSTDAGYIRARITEKIGSSSVLLCLVGPHTHKSEWVEWEIETAAELGKKVIGVGLNRGADDPLPAALGRAGAEVCGWDIDSIVKLIG
jgi:hypothetical protein